MTERPTLAEAREEFSRIEKVARRLRAIFTRDLGSKAHDMTGMESYLIRAVEEARDIYCPDCGGELTTLRFCPSCGVRHA